MCCIGFLQQNYVPLFHQYINKIAQVCNVWDRNDKSATKRKFVHHNIGCCVAGIMVNHCVPNVDDLFDTDNNHRSDDDSKKVIMNSENNNEQ